MVFELFGSCLRIIGRPKAIYENLHEIILCMLPVVDIKCVFMQVEILGNVQFIGETLPKFRQEVSVFSKWAWHRGDVRNSKGFVSGFEKIRGGSLKLVSEL